LLLRDYLRSEGIDSGESYVWRINATATQLRQYLEQGGATPGCGHGTPDRPSPLRTDLDHAVFTTRAADAPQLLG
jgi:hypothetical protein